MLPNGSFPFSGLHHLGQLLTIFLAPPLKGKCDFSSHCDDLVLILHTHGSNLSPSLTGQRVEFKKPIKT